MIIILNGEESSTDAASVGGLLESLDIDPRRVAVELNMEIVPKSEYETRRLHEGDRIEIVHFVGGGSTIRKI